MGQTRHDLAAYVAVAQNGMRFTTVLRECRTSIRGSAGCVSPLWRCCRANPRTFRHREIEQEMRNRYALFYRPEDLVQDGNSHPIHLEAKQTGKALPSSVA